MRRIIINSVVILLAAFACGNPDVGSPTPQPALTPEGVDAIQDALPVREDGQLRRPGLIMLSVVEGFDTGTLRTVHPAVRLLTAGEPRFGHQSLVIAVPDAFVAEAVPLLQGLAGVRDAQPYVLLETQGFIPNDPLWPIQEDAGLNLFELPTAWWLTGTGKSSVTVAVIDTGLTPVDELSGNIVPGYSFVEGPVEDTNDIHGHGTMVASIIAAHKDNRYGITGVAPGVKVLPLRACRPWLAGTSMCEPYAVIAALQWAYDHRDEIDVINMSLGSYTYYQDMEDELTMLDAWGVITVASAGQENGPVIYPAWSDHVIAATGVTNNGGKHPSANYGSQLDMAGPYEMMAITNTGLPEWFGATSASAAAVSGLAALYKSTGVQELTNKYWFREYVRIAAQAYGGGFSNLVGYGAPRVPYLLWTNNCKRMDYNNDREIDVVELQATSAHFGTFLGDFFFLPRYDVEPTWSDGDTDIKDVQKVGGRIWMRCR